MNMMQAEIDRAVALATGESRRLIARRGFSLNDPSSERADALQIALSCPGCGHQLVLHPQPFTPDAIETKCVVCDAVYDIRPQELFVVEAPRAALL